MLVEGLVFETVHDDLSLLEQLFILGFHLSDFDDVGERVKHLYSEETFLELALSVVGPIVCGLGEYLR